MRKQPIEDAAFAEAVALMDAGDIDALYLVAAAKIQSILKHVTDRVCEGVDGTKADTQLVIRAIARKTEESLSSVIFCVEGGHTYAATALLRQMCEELIFAKFIRSLARPDAD